MGLIGRVDRARCRIGALLAIAAATQVPAASAAADPVPGDILVIGQRAGLTHPADTGSRLGLTPLETPASIAVLDGDALRAHGDLTIVDAVTRAPGITSVANPGNGSTVLAARGFSGQGSVLQLVDGIRLFPVAGTITFPTDLWNLDRVEVLSAPASVLYGQGALGGAVNFVTKQPGSARTTIDAEASYGSQNTAHLAAGIAGPIDPLLSYRVDASYCRSDGIVDRGGSHGIALSGALRFATAEDVAITLRDDYGDQHATRYFGTPLIAHRLDMRIRKRNHNVADADMHFRDNRTTLSAEWRIARYQRHERRVPADQQAIVQGSRKLLLGGGGRLLPERLQRRSADAGQDLPHRQSRHRLRSDPKWRSGSVKISTPMGNAIANDLVVGFDYNLIKLTYTHDFGSDTQEDAVDPFAFAPVRFLDMQGIAPRFRTRTREYSIFAEDRLKLGARLSLVGGIRAEWDGVGRFTFAYDAAGRRSETNAFPGGAAKALDNVTDGSWRCTSRCRRSRFTANMRPGSIRWDTDDLLRQRVAILLRQRRSIRSDCSSPAAASHRPRAPATKARGHRRRSRPTASPPRPRGPGGLSCAGSRDMRSTPWMERAPPRR